jgi:hypothetical protein
VHLRYFAEGWMDRLLAFVRHFYMPQLPYWRYEELPGADSFSHIDPSDLEGREQAWAEVKQNLAEETAEWVQRGASSWRCSSMRAAPAISPRAGGSAGRTGRSNWNSTSSYYSLRTRFDPEGNKLYVQVSGAPPGSPDPAISADEAGGTEERNK